MKTRISDFDYPLPPESVAQSPLPQRDARRPPAAEGDCEGREGGPGSGTRLQSPPKPPPPTPYGEMKEGLKCSGKAAHSKATYRGRLRVGQLLNFGPSLQGEITSLPQPGVAEIRFWSTTGNVCQAVLAQGETPLPPYIRRAAEPPDQDRYQTMFAREPGAIACPTAGLHFTPETIHDMVH